MSKLGLAVLYTVLVAHETVLEKIEGAVAGVVDEILGSVHHPEMRQFAGIIGRESADGTCDIMLLVPNKEPRWVDGVAEGTEPGTFALVAGVLPLTEGQAAGADVLTAAAAATDAARAASSSASSAASSAGSASTSASNAASSANSAATSAGTAGGHAAAAADSAAAAKMAADAAKAPPVAA